MSGPWTEARHEELVALARSGASASQIAERIGGTRNSIIGRCHREGIKLGVGRPTPERTAKPKRERKPAPAPMPKPARERLHAWALGMVATLEAEPAPGEPIPFIGRPALTCSQIIGDPKAQPSMCCGRPVHWRKVYGEMSASSYCAEHFKRNTVAVQPRAPGPAYDASVQRVTQTVLMQARAFG